ATQEAGALLGNDLGRSHELVFAFDGAGAGHDCQLLAAANGHAIDVYDGIDGAEFPARLLEGLADGDDVLDVVVGREDVDQLGIRVADDADHDSFFAFGDVGLQTFGRHAFQHVVHVLLRCLGAHDDNHAVTP